MTRRRCRGALPPLPHAQLGALQHVGPVLLAQRPQQQPILARLQGQRQSKHLHRRAACQAVVRAVGGRGQVTQQRRTRRRCPAFGEATLVVAAPRVVGLVTLLPPWADPRVAWPLLLRLVGPQWSPACCCQLRRQPQAHHRQWPSAAPSEAGLGKSLLLPDLASAAQVWHEWDWGWGCAR